MSQQEDNKKKMLLGAAALGVGALVLYYLFSGNNEEESTQFDTSKPTGGYQIEEPEEPEQPLKGDAADDFKERESAAAAEEQEAERQEEEKEVSKPAPPSKPAPAKPAKVVKTFKYRNGKLQVIVVKATNLEAKDRGGTSDPFVKLGVNGKHEQKTKTVKKSLNPTWNEKFLFDVQDAVRDVLEVEVWDKDTLSNDKIGTVNIPVIDVCKGDGVLQQDFQLTKSKGKLTLRLTYAEPVPPPKK